MAQPIARQDLATLKIANELYAKSFKALREAKTVAAISDTGIGIATDLAASSKSNRDGHYSGGERRGRAERDANAFGARAQGWSSSS